MTSLGSRPGSMLYGTVYQKRHRKLEDVIPGQRPLQHLTPIFSRIHVITEQTEKEQSIYLLPEGTSRADASAERSPVDGSDRSDCPAGRRSGGELKMCVRLWFGADGGCSARSTCVDAGMRLGTSLRPVEPHSTVRL